MNRRYVSFITKTGTSYKDSRNKFDDDNENSLFHFIWMGIVVFAIMIYSL